MRSTPDPVITNHRLGRLLAWARLWLCWLVGAFVHLGDPALQHKALTKAARLAATTIVLQAVARFRPPPRCVHRHARLKQRGLFRAATGSALRRMLRGKDPFTRLAAILAVVRDAETHIGQMLRHLHRGLTRRRAVKPAPSAEPRIQHAPRTEFVCVDTS